MNISKLLIKAYKLLDAAQVEDGLGNSQSANAYLSVLRSILNEQPELEAWGAHNPDKSTQGRNHDN